MSLISKSARVLANHSSNGSAVPLLYAHGNKLHPNEQQHERDRGRGQNASHVQVDPLQNSCPTDSFRCLERAYGLLGWGSL